MSVELDPPEFTRVLFDADRLREIVAAMVERVGMDADAAVVVKVNEMLSSTAARVEELDPPTLYLESGVIEHPKKPRHMSDDSAEEAVGRLLLEVVDRQRPGFGAPPMGEGVALEHRVAWDISLVGRLSRWGGRVQRQRRLYQFRHRHGFTDEATAAFDELWSGDDPTYEWIVSLSDRAMAARGS